MNSKKLLSGIVGILLVIAMIAVLAGCASMEQRVFTGMKNLQAAKAMQARLSMDAAMNVDLAGTKQSVPMNMSMDFTKSGDNMALKGTVIDSASGSSQETPLELYVKDGYSYARMTNSDKYAKAKFTSAQNIDPVGQYINALKDLDLTQARFTFEKASLDIGGKSVQTDKVKVSLPDSEAAKLMQSLMGDALKGLGQGSANTSAIEGFLKGMTIKDFSFTLYLSGDNIVREEVATKVDYDLSKVSIGVSGLEGSMSMDFNIGVDILKTADTLPIAFPDFNDNNTVTQ